MKKLIFVVAILVAVLAGVLVTTPRDYRVKTYIEISQFDIDHIQYYKGITLTLTDLTIQPGNGVRVFVGSENPPQGLKDPFESRNYVSSVTAYGSATGRYLINLSTVLVELRELQLVHGGPIPIVLEPIALSPKDYPSKITLGSAGIKVIK